METVSWTDEKMDTLSKKVDDGFGRMDVEFARTNGRIESLAVGTDGRLAQVDQRFDQVDQRFSEVDRRFDEVDRRFNEVDRRFDKVERRFDRLEETMMAGFDRIDAKFDAMHRLLIQVCGGLIGTLILALVTVIATR
jgi:chromosome segregation ATPase